MFCTTSAQLSADWLIWFGFGRAHHVAAALETNAQPQGLAARAGGPQARRHLRVYRVGVGVHRPPRPDARPKPPLFTVDCADPALRAYGHPVENIRQNRCLPMVATILWT